MKMHNINIHIQISIVTIYIVVHSPDVEWCYCDKGQFGDTC